MGGYQRITVAPIAGACGAEIAGVDLADELDAATVAEIRQALLDHLVIFFRGQNLTPERQKAATRRFGKIFVHPNFNTGDKDPEMVFIMRRPTDARITGEEWHADTTMMPAPPMGAILHALEIPAYGGDTIFANQYLAYETLSDGMKRMLAGLRAVHNDTRVAGPQAGLNKQRSSKVREDPDWRPTESVHPVVRTHPETGRKCLFVNSVYIQRLDNMTAAESQPILDYLYAHATRPEFTCRFRWSPGAVAFWDNRCVQHIAVNDAQLGTRHMQRTQIAGERVA